MRLETDLEFQQSKINRLNAKYNVDMSSTRLRGGKAFVAEQKIREFKKLLLKSKGIEKRLKIRLNPNNLITKATNNLIYAKSAKLKKKVLKIQFLLKYMIFIDSTK